MSATSRSGLLLAHLSDLHYDGRRRAMARFRGALQAAAAAGCDHVLLAGDLVDYAEPRHLRDLADVLREEGWWDPARLSALPGNHDLYRHSYANLGRMLLRFPSLARTRAAFDEVFGEVMGTPIAGESLPALKPLGAGWHLLLLDTVVRTHRLDYLGSWEGWLDEALTAPTLAAVRALDPARLVVAGHHFPMARSAATHGRARGTAFADASYAALLRLLGALEPRPAIYLCGHIHFWGRGQDAFEGEVAAGVPVYCQGRTGGADGVPPSWTRHALDPAGGVESRLVSLD
ncbi:MAG: metallophosphoesterase [Planctomycetota bacterium]